MGPSAWTFTQVSVADSPPVEFCIDPAAGDPVAPWLLSHDWIDEPVMRAFLAWARPGARMIDLGCHIGTFSLPAAALGAEVLAVDANARQVEQVRTAAQRNGFERLHVIHGAVSDADSRVRFIENGPHGRVWRPEDSDHAAPVMPISVDALLDRYDWDSVDAIKMDIEGSEPAALRGMRRLFRRGVRPVFVFECNGDALPLYGSSTYALRQTLVDLGYELLMIDHLRPGTLVRTAATAMQPECATDYLAMPACADSLDARWTIESSFTREQAATRWLDSASEPAPGYRRYAAETLARGPSWLADEPMVAPAARALACDVNDSVRDGLLPSGSESAVRQAPIPPLGGPPADTVVFARGVSVGTRPGEPERPLVDGRRAPVDAIVSDVSFHLRARQSLAVQTDDVATGSALLATIAGLVEPLEGELSVRRPVTLISNPGLVFEPEQAVRENVILYAAYLGGDAGRAAALAPTVAEAASVGDMFDLPLGELTDELQARLALAVAGLCVEPRLLLIDRLAEIDDPAFRRWFVQQILHLHNTGTALIQATDGARLLAPAGRMLWVLGSRVEACGHFESVAALAAGAGATPTEEAACP